MQENRVKRVMREGGLALVSRAGPFWGPHVVEMAGRAGFDGIRIDLEHSGMDLNDIYIKVLAAERVGITPIIRPPSFDHGYILQLLDMGVQGITIPHISNAEEARAAVRVIRYAPVGDRGMGTHTRAAEWGTVPMKQHMEQSNKEILVAVLIEDIEALEDIDSIAAIDGLDMISIGVNDLGKALGVATEVDPPKLVSAVDRIVQAVKKNPGKFLSISEGQRVFPRTMLQLREMGVTYMHCGPSPDVRLMKGMLEQVEKLRSQLA